MTMQHNIHIAASSCVSNTAPELAEMLALKVEQLDKALIPATLRRRTSLTTQLAIHAAFNACQAANADPKILPTVFASVGGEVDVTDQICIELTKETVYVSPTQFHNSVHNTSAAYWSIVTGNQQSSTALGAGQQTIAMALLEAWTRLQVEGGQLLLVCYEEIWPHYLANGMGQQAVAMAVLLSAEQIVNTAKTVSIACPQPHENMPIAANNSWPISADLAELIKSVPILALAPLLQVLQLAEQQLQPLCIPLDGVPSRWLAEIAPHTQQSD